jgi:hypothetical protein
MGVVIIIELTPTTIATNDLSDDNVYYLSGGET